MKNIRLFPLSRNQTCARVFGIPIARLYCIALLLLFASFVPGTVAAVTITGGDIPGYSEYKDGTYHLTPGDYIFAGPPALSGHLAIAAGTDIQAIAPSGTALAFNGGGLTMHGGTITAMGVGSFGKGIAFSHANAFFTQNGGILRIVGNNGFGVHFSAINSTFFHNDGSLSVTGGGSEGFGIWFSDQSSVFVQNGGTLHTRGESNKGHGIRFGARNVKFEMNGGTLYAEGLNSGSGILMVQTNSLFSQQGGTTYLLPGDGSSAAINLAHASSMASFGPNALLRPVIALGDTPLSGYINSGQALIEPGARLEPLVSNSLALAKNAGTGHLPFLTVTGSAPVSGNFISPSPTMTLRYDYDTGSGGGKIHTLSVTRTAYASEVATKGNGPALQALERNAGWLTSRPALVLSEAYALLDESASAKELNKRSRGLSPWGSLRFNRQAIADMDTVQSALSERLDGGLLSSPRSEGW